MNDEIKEILDYLKIENGTIGSELSYEETHLLLDYITNLQQEVEKLNEDKRGILLELYKANDKRDKLQEENEMLMQADKNTYETSQEIMAELTRENDRLKKECKQWKENHKAVCIQRDNILDNIVKDTEERIDYKSRCEKVQEIINTEKKLMGYAIYDSCLLLIEEALNGRSDE